jgi:hypothetical protein
MLVHAHCRPGEHIDEAQPFDPAYAYPQSKLEVEKVIAAEHGHIPYVILPLAGVYDEKHVIQRWLSKSRVSMGASSRVSCMRALRSPDNRSCMRKTW